MSWAAQGVACLGGLSDRERLENDRAVASMHETEAAARRTLEERAGAGSFFASPAGFLVAAAGAAGVALALGGRR